jgi:hypothetical protein
MLVHGASQVRCPTTCCSGRRLRAAAEHVIVGQTSVADPDDETLATVVLRRIEDRMPDPSSLRGLTEVEADLICGVTAKGIIDNGGHAYWFEGMDRERTLRAAAAFERMGLASASNALRQCLAAFPGGAPARAYLRDHREELREAFSASDRIFWDIDFDAVAAAYIRARRADLLATDPGLKTLVPALVVQ